LNADPRILDDRGPLRRLLLDARAELLRRAGVLLQTQTLHRGPHVGTLQRLERVLVDARDDTFRRRSGHNEAIPLDRLESGIAGLRYGRQLRQRFAALETGTRQRAQPSVLDKPDRRGGGAHVHLDLAREYGSERGTGSFIGDMHHVDPGDPLEEL